MWYRFGLKWLSIQLLSDGIEGRSQHLFAMKSATAHELAGLEPNTRRYIMKKYFTALYRWNSLRTPHICGLAMSRCMISAMYGPQAMSELIDVYPQRIAKASLPKTKQELPNES